LNDIDGHEIKSGTKMRSIESPEDRSHDLVCVATGEGLAVFAYLRREETITLNQDSLNISRWRVVGE
jgi:hypothetical protein